MPRARRFSPNCTMRSNTTLPSGMGRASRCPTGSITSSMYGIVCSSGGRGNQHHPSHAELVLHHTEFRREERLAERHLDLAAAAERGEHLVGLGDRKSTRLNSSHVALSRMPS